MSDAFRQFVEGLAETNDWAAILRFSLSMAVDEEAFETAIECLKRSQSLDVATKFWLEKSLNNFYEAIPDPDFDWGPLPEAGWSVPERTTLEIMRLYPQAVLCETALRYPERDVEQLYASGRAAARKCAQLAKSIGDAGLEACFSTTIAIGESQRLQFRAARRNLRRCVKLHSRLYARYPEVYAGDAAGSFMNLGVVLEQLLHFKEADERYGQALQIYMAMTPALREDHVIDYVATLNNRGVQLRILAQPEAARAYHQRAIDLLKEFVSHSETDVREQIASTFNNIGIAFSALKLLDDAIKAHRFSLKWYRQIAADRDPPDLRDVEKVAIALINSSRACFAAEQFGEALQEAEAAREICEPLSLPPFVRMAANSASLIGKIQAHQNRWNESLDAAETAVAKFAQLSQQTWERGSPAHVAALNNLGNLLDQMGRSGEAETTYQEALQVSDHGQQSSVYYGAEERLAVLRNLVCLLLVRYRSTREVSLLAEVRPFLQAAVSIGELWRGRFQSPWLRENVLEQLCDVYDLIVEVEVESSQLPAPPEKCLERAFLAAEARRVRTLTEMLAEQEPGSTTAPTALVERYYAIRRTLRQTEWLLYKAILRYPGDGFHAVNAHAAPVGGGDRRSAFEAQLKQLQQQRLELQTCLQEIQQADLSFQPVDMIELASVESVRRMLPHDRAAAVQFTLTKNNGYAIVITRTDTKAIILADNVVATVKQVTGDWLEQYQQFQVRTEYSPAAFKALSAALSQAIDTLGECVFRPVLTTLPPEIESLIVAPHRALHLFPFAAVSADGSGGGRCLEQYEITLVPSFSILARCAGRENLSREKLLLIDPPSFDLHFHELEALAVQQLYGNAVIRTPTGEPLSKAAMLAVSSEANVWYFLGHSEFQRDAPLQSALELGAERLTLAEIYEQLRLPQTRLCVLSACEGGLLRPDPLDEYVSLPLAMLYAGAGCVLSALWEVDDLPTFLLLDRFFGHFRQGCSPAYALQQSQLWLQGKPDRSGEALADGAALWNYMNSSRLQSLFQDDIFKEICFTQIETIAKTHVDQPPFHDPLYWAGFVVTGLCE